MVRMIRPDGGECRVHESRVEEYRKLGHLVAEETGRDAPLSGGASGTPPLRRREFDAPSSVGCADTFSPGGRQGAAKGKAGKRKEATGHE